jgi:hypothetical protein
MMYGQRNRRACENGHWECLGPSQKGQTCNWDPARCERSRLWKGSHLWDICHECGANACVRCQKGHAGDCPFYVEAA